MARQHIENGFSRTLEFVILAIMVGCTLWLTVLAAGIPGRLFAG